MERSKGGMDEDRSIGVLPAEETEVPRLRRRLPP